MKKIYLPLVFLSSFLTAQQGFLLPVAAADFERDLCVSPTGDRILAGRVALDTVIGLDLDPGRGETRFPGTLTRADSGSAAYLASYAPNGDLNFALLLADTSRGANDVRAFFVDTDYDGNIYLQGNFSGSVDFAPGEAEYIVATPQDRPRMTYLASYTETGEFRFVITLPDYQPSIYPSGRVRQFGVDGGGNSYSLIGFSDAFDYDPGEADFILDGKRPVIASYDRTGAFRFAFETIHAPYVLGVAKMGDFYLGGEYRSEDFARDLDPQPDSEYFLPESDAPLAHVVLSFTNEAKLNFVHPMVGRQIFPYLLDGDKDGNLYMAGPMHPGEADFDFSAETFLLKVDATYADHDYFLAKYASDGALVRALLLEEKADTFALEEFVDYSLSDDGDIYLSGRMYGENLDLDPSENEALVSGQGAYGERALIAGYDSDLNYRFGYTLGDTTEDNISDAGIWFKIAPSNVCGDYVLMADVPLPQTIDFDPRQGSAYVPMAVAPGRDTVGLALITYSHDLVAGESDCLLSGLRGENDPAVSALRTFPNPSQSGNFEVDLSFAEGKAAEYLVADLSGRIIQRGRVSESAVPFRLDLSNQPTGVYIAKFRTEGRTAVAKLVVGGKPGA
ncbi:putative secreted protein (Por secretion system target) [Neolewinella xylanilytica]|uniref:Putative secreted protein (Por secretion system target) n=1 Tax=Neolewinella xylanilytica TaxID=1514080 RepID=A0A2S6I289_9BACT|nr:T9SS type A sorting domain-containing protein [Neolewinella xylanilytica]PPK85201.1 putative secreted protein (Por secretion system target) [Neolewinella xylanilytica]